MMGHMPAIPESTRSSITLRLLDHAEKNWPQLAKVRARYHGSFAYITGVLRDGQQIPLFRLRYGGSAHSFGFAIYSAASDRYQDTVLPPDSRPAPRKKPSTPPAPSTSQRPDTNPHPDPDELTMSPTKSPDFGCPWMTDEIEGTTDTCISCTCGRQLCVPRAD